MMYILSKNHRIGVHKYRLSRYSKALFLNVSDAQCNPLNPEEIVAGIHSAKRFYALAKFRDGSLVKLHIGGVAMSSTSMLRVRVPI